MRAIFVCPGFIPRDPQACSESHRDTAQTTGRNLEVFRGGRMADAFDALIPRVPRYCWFNIAIPAFAASFHLLSRIRPVA